jgi:hypothetical protein
MDSLTELYAALNPKSDKGTVHSYIPTYDQLLAPYRRPGVQMLEVGIFQGYSIRLWEKFFAEGQVYGVDLHDHPLDMVDLKPMIAEGTHNLTFCDAASSAQMDQHFPGKLFDVVIEDASHSLSQQLSIYHNFKKRMAPGGIYVIEDVGDLNTDRRAYELIDQDKTVRIIDLRSVKGRFDDVLVVILDKA